MATKIEIPNDAKLPAKLAEVLHFTSSGTVDTFGRTTEYWEQRSGFGKSFKGWACKKSEWSPLTDRNHSRLAVEECFRIGLGQLFTQLVVAEEDRTWDTDPLRFAQAVARSTPAQESRAAFITLSEYHQKKEKP